MNGDIRLSMCFRGHRKIKKLKRALGAEGVLALVNLWIGTAASKPKGILHGWDEEDICLEAEWGEDPQSFIDTLIQLNLLEIDKAGVYHLHNWEKHQAWVVGAPERSKAATTAAKARWEAKRSNTSKPNAERMRAASGGHAEGMRSASGEQCPSPTLPLPTQLSSTKEEFTKGEIIEKDGNYWNEATGEMVETPFG